MGESVTIAAVEKKWWEPIWAGFRWVTFIPGGFIAGMLACILAQLFIGGNMWLFGERFDTPFSRLFAAGMLGYISVMAAAVITPIADKTIPAIVMAVIMFMLYGVAIFLCIMDKEWFQIAQGVVGVIAVAVAMYQQIEESRKPQHQSPFRYSQV